MTNMAAFILHCVSFLFLFIAVLLCRGSGELHYLFQFQHRGYKSCAFYFTDVFGSMESAFIDALIVSNQNGQPWKIQRPHFSKREWLERRHLDLVRAGRLSCTVDFVFLFESCFHEQLGTVLRGRETLSTSFVIVIVPSSAKCSQNDFKYSQNFGGPTFIYYLPKYLKQTGKIFAHCQFCKLEPSHLPLVKMNYFTMSVSHMRGMWTSLRKHFGGIEVFLGTSHSGRNTEFKNFAFDNCPMLLLGSDKKQLQEKKKKIGCDSVHVPLERLGIRLNFTIKYIDVEEVRYSKVRLNYTALIMADTLIEMFPLALRQLLTVEVVTGATRQRLGYCSNQTQVRQHFDYTFWFYPFDLTTWICLLCTCAWIQLVPSRRFTDYSKFMSPLLAFSVFITLVLYEGLISAILTIRPPYVTISSAKDLLLKEGYKIDELGNISDRMKTNLYDQLIRQEGFTNKQINSSIRVDYGFHSFLDSILKLARLRVTKQVVIIPRIGSILDEWEFLYKETFKNIQCHTIPPFITEEIAMMTFDGAGKYILQHVTKQFFEVGLIAEERFLSLYRHFMVVYKRKARIQSNQVAPLPFAIDDLKIGSIFLSLIASLAIFTAFFFLEKLYFQAHRYFRSLWFIISFLYHSVHH